jgi:hypothetical protein
MDKSASMVNVLLYRVVVKVLYRKRIIPVGRDAAARKRFVHEKVGLWRRIKG